jgi:hypothetical protein
LSEGVISLPAARALAEETASLARTDALEVESRVLAGASGRTPSQLRAAARRAVARIDADAVHRRAEQARRQRYVRLIPEPDGMATINAYLPAPEAVSLYGVLDECARRTVGPDDPRSMDARRADAFTDLVLDRLANPTSATPAPNESGESVPALETPTPSGDPAPAPAGAPTYPTSSRGSGAVDTRASRAGAQERDRVGVQVRVTVGLSTLLGLDQLPGELAGYGPIPADDARELASHGTWRRLITDPVTGALLDYGTTRYRPPPHLADHVITRDQTCDFPSCRVPAHRCDLDHRVPFDPETGTGATSAENLGARCRTHHNLKASPGWTLARDSDGTITWHTPTSHTYHRPSAPVSEPHRQPIGEPAGTTRDGPPF